GDTWRRSPRPSPPPTGRRSSGKPSPTPGPATRRHGTGCRNTWWATSRWPWSSWRTSWHNSNRSWGWAMKAATLRRDLATLRQTAQADGALPPALPEPDESMSVAREMASAFAALVKSYAETFDVPQEEAAARVGE